MEPKQPKLREWIEQLPLTDRELEALQAAQKATETDKPAEAKKEPAPDPQKIASKFTGPARELADQICEQILSSGRETLIKLVALVLDPAEPSFTNYKPEYLLHCLVIYAGRPGKDQQRRLLAETLASQLRNGQLSTYVRGFLIRELQWVGDAQIAPDLGRLLDHDELCQGAVSALIALNADATGRILRAGFEKAQGRNQLSILQALAGLREPDSTALLRKAAAHENGDFRLAALWGLANRADATSIDLLLKAADAESNYERSKATQACLLLAENLAATGKSRDAAKIYTHLRDTRKEKSNKYIRDLAEAALRSLVV